MRGKKAGGCRRHQTDRCRACIADAVTQAQISAHGKLDAAGPFRAQAPKPAVWPKRLTQRLRLTCAMACCKGFDLASAAQSLLKGGAGGGSTQFDQLTGAVKVQGRALKLQNVRVTSGVLKAIGNVDISPAKQLAGASTPKSRAPAGWWACRLR